VEDDAALRTFYKGALMVAGYRVITAGDGIAALRQIEAQRPSAIVLDLGLPGLSGFGVNWQRRPRRAMFRSWS